MEFFHSNNHKLQPKEKKRLTQDQVRLLETSFNHDKKLEPELKMHLARDLGLHPRKVAIWYQNRRARWKSQSLELDCKALQLRLDATLADKRRLEREVARLKAELEKAQEKLLGVSNPLQPRPSSLSSSCDDDGSSTLPGNLNCCWENAGAYQVEELYAFLMGAEAQTGN